MIRLVQSKSSGQSDFGDAEQPADHGDRKRRRDLLDEVDLALVSLSTIRASTISLPICSMGPWIFRSARGVKRLEIILRYLRCLRVVHLDQRRRREHVHPRALRARCLIVSRSGRSGRCRACFEISVMSACLVMAQKGMPLVSVQRIDRDPRRAASSTTSWGVSMLRVVGRVDEVEAELAFDRHSRASPSTGCGRARNPAGAVYDNMFQF